MCITNQTMREILNYEKMLQTPKNFSIEDLSMLIDENFYEVGQSGKSWNKEQIIEYFNQQISNTKNPCVVTMEDEKFVTVDKSIVLITYIFKQTDASSNFSSSSRRSSLWKKQGEKWVMLFHQGTPVVSMSEEEI